MEKWNAQYKITADQFEKYIEHILKCFADFMEYPRIKREIAQKEYGFTRRMAFEINWDTWYFDDIIFILRYNDEVNSKWLKDWQKYERSGEDKENHFYIDMWHYCEVAESLGDKYSTREVVKSIYWKTMAHGYMEANRIWREMMNTVRGRVLFRINNGRKTVKNICVFLGKQYNKITKLFSNK